ncbi:MAG: GreA/GreB family elongation factor, partial [Clostridiales bacterium]|nr:GreA/GreB family elongation factor [Clostridiales bacterium]
PFNGIISNVSPIGKGLLKHKVGDEVEIETPGGKVTLEIRKIQMYSAGKEE